MNELVDKISRDMTIEEIFSNFPHKSQKLAQALTQAGLHCVGCHAATWETLESGMYGHGMTDEQIDSLVKILNTIIEEKVDLQTISLTERAAQKFKQILAEENKDHWGLRLEEAPGGCGGFEFSLDFSEKALEEDEIFESQGIEIHVSKAIMSRMLGTEIDYVDGLKGAGFKISNPNVKSSCSCGTSHNY